MREFKIIIRALMFRQDYRINKIFLPFSRSAGPAAERQKASSLFKGNRSLIASTKQ
jgi:hypothetical protein